MQVLGETCVFELKDTQPNPEALKLLNLGTSNGLAIRSPPP